MAEHESPAKMAMFAIRTRMNHEAMFFFIGSMAVLAGVFIIFHLMRVVSKKLRFDQALAKTLPLALKFIR